ncbi:iron ABC transporter permease [Streptomyces sp. WY228]|nr:iron ABC transporter permease [Streptomyces sp. WY228]
MPRAPRLSRRATATAAAVVALLLAILLSLAVGARSIPPGEVLDTLLLRTCRGILTGRLHLGIAMARVRARFAGADGLGARRAGRGGRDQRAWADVVQQVWPFLLLGAVLVLSVARGLDALALGEDVAKGLGQNVAAVRITGGIGATVLTGVGVAAAGPIAFIGLAVPHIARAVVGNDHRWVLPMAALIGPVMLLVSDVVGRIVFPPSEVPAGVMTALIGVPFLVALVRRKAVPA